MNLTVLDDLFEECHGITSLVFMLTKLKCGDVKAELITDRDDPRLDSKEAFAAIRSDHFILHENGAGSLEDITGGTVERYIYGVGTSILLRPRLYRQLGGDEFIAAVAELNGDAVLTLYDEDADEYRWHPRKSPI